MNILFVLAFYIATVDSKIIMESFQHCDPKGNSDIAQFFIKCGMFQNDTQYCNMTGEFKEPITNDMRYWASVETSRDGQKWRRGINIRDKNYCKSYTTVIGDMWKQVEIQSNIPQGKCPMPKTKLKVTFLQLKLDLIGLDKFPRSMVKITSRGYKPNVKDPVVCVIAVFNIS